MLTEANVEFSQPWHDKLTNADDEEGVWLGNIVVFFKGKIYFKHKPHLTIPLKAITTCFLFKKSTSINLSSKHS
jgi:hypothetical protein